MKTNTQANFPESVRITNVQDLIDAGLIPASGDPAIEKTAEQFSIALSPHLVGILQSGLDNTGAVARQYIPDPAELKTTPDEDVDPIGDHAHSPVKGIVHRYPDRALLKITNVCAVYCRFCFRRELIGPGTDHLSEFEIEQAVKYIRDHKDIWEVILTGGDPLILSPARLRKMMDRLDAIDHVRLIRIHTRIPVADPHRITPALLSALQTTRQPLYMALHINHADEITPDVITAIEALKAAKINLLSQTVLLKSVNDDPAVLTSLFRRLVELGIKPYELHHPDKAKGTGHFRVSLKEGQAIYAALRGRISGLCIPHYMLDIPGGHGKIAVNPAAMEDLSGGLYKVQDFQGNTHIYKDR